MIAPQLVGAAGEVVPADAIHVADYSAEAGREALEVEVILRNATDCTDRV